jgi:hypothetical protein
MITTFVDAERRGRPVHCREVTTSAPRPRPRRRGVLSTFLQHTLCRAGQHRWSACRGGRAAVPSDAFPMRATRHADNHLTKARHHHE